MRNAFLITRWGHFYFFKWAPNSICSSWSVSLAFYIFTAIFNFYDRIFFQLHAMQCFLKVKPKVYYWSWHQPRLIFLLSLMHDCSKFMKFTGESLHLWVGKPSKWSQAKLWTREVTQVHSSPCRAHPYSKCRSPSSSCSTREQMNTSPMYIFLWASPDSLK